jgi:hypothetical protein
MASTDSDQQMADSVAERHSVGCRDVAKHQLYHPPKLGIAHLLAWMGVAAIAMKAAAYDHQVLGTLNELPPWLQAASRVADYVGACVRGAGLVGMGVIVYDKLRGAAGRLDAGHWLIVILTGGWLLYTVVRLPWQLGEGILDEPATASVTRIKVFAYSGSQAVVGLVLLGLVIVSGNSRRWRVLFAAIGGATLIASLKYLCGYFANRYSLEAFFDPSKGELARQWCGNALLTHQVESIAIYVTPIVLLAAVVADLAQRRRHDGLHWLGVVLLAFGLLETFSLHVLWLVHG